MTDKELLELAAKAAGLWEDTFMLDDEWQPMWDEPHGFLLGWGEGIWNPLTDDGDALRLAVKLVLDVEVHDSFVQVGYTIPYGYSAVVEEYFDENNDDPYATTRRAIVRAAASIVEQSEAVSSSSLMRTAAEIGKATV